MIKRGAKSAKKQAFPNIGPKYTRSKLLHWCLSLVLVLSILSISAASIFNAGKLQKTIDSTTRTYEMDVAFQVAQDIDERLSHVSLELEMIADSLVRIDASADKLQFLERKKMLTGFTQLAVADLNGHALASDGTAMEIGEMEGFLQAKAGSRGISVLDEQSILYAVPITREETVTGVLIGIRDKESMQALVENNSFRGNGSSCIVDKQGNVIISPVNLNLFLALDDVFSDKRDQEFTEEVEKMKQDMQEGENGQLSFHIGTGEKVIMSYHALSSYDWVLLTLIPADLISKESNQFIFQTFLITFFTMVVFSFILLSMFYIYRSNQKNLEQVAFTDPVTGGINNARFQIFCRMLLQQNAEDSYCIVSLNIQNFRLINESFGIEEGNRTLRHILQVLEHALYPGELAARGEADNFYLLLREKKDSMVEARTQRLVKKINSFNLGKEHPYFLTISRGAYFITDPSLEVTVMQDRANTARKSKEGIRGDRCVFYDTVDVIRIKWEKEMEDLLEGSLKNQDFQVYLQPKVGLKEDSVVGAEALVRWRHPQKGVMLPSDFVPVFERDGSICKLDRYVFEEVCRMLSRWREEGRPLFPISLNLSRCHFQIPDFLSYFERLKRKYQIPDGLIEMELTESVFFQDEDIETVKHTLEKMHRLGFRCSLDDFGSGYSSLGLLKEFEVDAVKLDRSFFADGMRRRGEDVVEGVIALSKKLHLYTVAEGIETREQVEFLKRVRCDAIQGYFYSKPLPMNEFEHWVEKWNHK